MDTEACSKMMRGGPRGGRACVFVEHPVGCSSTKYTQQIRKLGLFYHSSRSELPSIE
jgi:hypothetical protein